MNVWRNDRNIAELENRWLEPDDDYDDDYGYDEQATRDDMIFDSYRDEYGLY